MKLRILGGLTLALWTAIASSAALVVLPQQLVVDSDGAPRSGAKLHTYQCGTTTALTSYTTAAVSTAHTNPVIAVATGLFPSIYFPDSVTCYKLVLKDSDGVTIWTEDNIPVVPQYVYNDVRNYGAVGDGVTDDTAEVQAAIDALDSVYIPFGYTFYVTGGTAAPIVPTIDLDSDTYLYGGGTILCDTNAQCLRADDAENVHVRGIRVEGNTAGTSQNGISFSGVTNGSIIGNELENLARGISLGWDQDADESTERVVVSENRLLDMGDVGIFVINAVTDIVISENVIYQVGIGATIDFGMAIIIDDGTSTDDDDAVPSSTIVIANNTIREVRGDTTSVGLLVSGSTDVLITGNLLHDIGATGAVGMDGIVIRNGAVTPDNPSARVTVEGNKLIDVGGDAIRAETASHLRIANNYIKNWGANVVPGNSSAIEFETEVDDSHIVGNTFISGDDSELGINIAASNCEDNRIDGNIFDQALGSITEIQDVGTTTRYGSGENSTETRTTSGAFSIYKLESKIDSTSGAVAATLANGDRVGQRKVIRMSNASNASTLTVATHETSSPEVGTFDNTADVLVLEWTGATWWTVKNIGVVF